MAENKEKKLEFLCLTKRTVWAAALLILLLMFIIACNAEMLSAKKNRVKTGLSSLHE